ncbi:Homeobox protein HD-10 [Neolecta irregularis DAH-3]|uniref:Homeobox protein HD-10 n=1 Tax=Neolecta irregularis (strain DAH-3) TaxID=1198029 RepID=A0A1U7LME2_NEOID|nr:Homeobox protein HD-10 [Neolecta irregularis DAH-3]|eukprot:OLL23825.1 Homeobox protein HD-10 [Neolecta irregularis DAH-3]
MPAESRPRRGSRSSSASASSARLMSVDFLTGHLPESSAAAPKPSAAAATATAASRPLSSQEGHGADRARVRLQFEDRARAQSIPPARLPGHYEKQRPVLPGVRELTSGMAPYIIHPTPPYSPIIGIHSYQNNSHPHHYPYPPLPYPDYPLPQPHALKPKRKRATTAQLTTLNKIFEKTFFPSTELRARLGTHLGMHPRTVQIWFQNRRQQWRAQNGECGGTTDDERGAWQVLQMEFGR